jgi:hypothetical protein
MEEEANVIKSRSAGSLIISRALFTKIGTGAQSQKEKKKAFKRERVNRIK